MNAEIYWSLEHVTYNSEDKTGWYLIRNTICNGGICDRVFVAQFNKSSNKNSIIDADVNEVVLIKDAVKNNKFNLVLRDI